jgi:cation diffusion facilitator CzcD-associated flavoprotein CzcO
VRLSQEVQSCVFDQKTAIWRVKIKDLSSGDISEDKANFVVNAKGNLNIPKWPDIPGLDQFQGVKMHSHTWDDKFDYKDKTIAVIGGGSSAAQIIPSIQPLAKKVVVFNRTPRWISPPFLSDEADKVCTPDSGYEITEETKATFAKDPVKYQKYIQKLHQSMVAYYPSLYKDSPILAPYEEMTAKQMSTVLAALGDKLSSKMIPKYPILCNRLIPGLPYLAALKKPNVTLTTSPITRFTAAGIVTADGQTHQVDAIVAATGYHASSAPPFPIIGRDGVDLKDSYSPLLKTYLGIMYPSHPNYAAMFGPYSYITAGSLTTMLESQGDYIVQLLSKLQRDNYRSLVPQITPTLQFGEYADRFFARTILSANCASWTKDNATGRVTGMWPGSILQARAVLSQPRWEDFEFVLDDRVADDDGAEDAKWDNAIGAAFGNGWTDAGLSGKPEELATFIDPAKIDFPELYGGRRF